MDAGADLGICDPPLPFLSPFPFPSTSHPLPFEVRPFKPATGLGERCKLPSAVWGRAPTENEFGALYAAIKPLVAITLNILSNMFYSKTIKIYH